MSYRLCNFLNLVYDCKRLCNKRYYITYFSDKLRLISITTLFLHSVNMQFKAMYVFDEI